MMSTPRAHHTLDFAETLNWLTDMRLANQPDVAAKARLLLLDTLACATAAMAEPELNALSAGLAASAPGTVQWPGATALTPASAAFLAATAACWHEACEGLARAHGRPGLHAIPVAVSLGLARSATLGAVLDAVVCGYEVGARAGEAMRIRAGLHVDGTWGVFAAAAAAARLMKLDAVVTLRTLAMAACQLPTSLYAPIAAGRTARNTYIGHAALLAIHAAESASAGITAPEDVFTAAARVLGGSEPVTSWPWAVPGEFLILEGYLKPYAAVRHVHYAAACAQKCWSQRSGRTADIEALVLHTYPEALTYCGNRHASTPIQAQFSLTHGVAVMLRTGALGPEAYAPGVFADAEHNRLERMITLAADPSIACRGARLTVITKRSSEQYHVDAVPGDPTHPMTAAEVAIKSQTYMAPVIGAAAARTLVSYVMSAPLEAPFVFPASQVASVRVSKVLG